MKIKQYFLYGLTSATLLILGSQNDANASLKNQFKQRSSCTYETAPYEKVGVPHPFLMNKYVDYRYCVLPNKQIIHYTKFNNSISEKTPAGKVGESELHWQGNSFYLTEYEIDGNELIKYSCQSSNGDGCSGQLIKRVLGTKGRSQSKFSNNQNNNVISNRSKIRNGVDTEIYNNGDKYVGNWVNGKQDGQGTYTWSNGDKYVGDWKNGNRTGKGTFTWADGDKYEGDYVDDKRTGKGTYFFSNGDKYEGDWKNSKRTGKGTFTWSNGDKYVGDWKNGNRTGKGTFTWADGRKYVGDFVDGTLEGEGIYTPLNGEILEGQFENNNLVKSYKVNQSNITTTTSSNSSNDSTEEKPNFQNLEKEVKGMFKNFF